MISARTLIAQPVSTSSFACTEAGLASAAIFSFSCYSRRGSGYEFRSPIGRAIRRRTWAA
jgi:hypothetical protein